MPEADRLGSPVLVWLTGVKRLIFWRTETRDALEAVASGDGRAARTDSLVSE
jgi:hypothetical protein